MKLEKLTDTPSRRYHDACGAAHALDLVGERWALLIVRELMMGPRRFGDLRADLCGLSANVLTQRLEGLEASGIVRRRKLPPPASVQVYELTDWGREAHPVFAVLGRWAARSPRHDPTLPLSAVSCMMSMETMFQADRAPGVRAVIGFVFGEQSFIARIADGALVAQRGETEGADVVFSGSVLALPEYLYGKRPLVELEAEARLAVSGDRALAERYQTWFDLPEKAAST